MPRKRSRSRPSSLGAVEDTAPMADTRTRRHNNINIITDVRIRPSPLLSSPPLPSPRSGDCAMPLSGSKASETLSPRHRMDAHHDKDGKQVDLRDTNGKPEAPTIRAQGKWVAPTACALVVTTAFGLYRLSLPHSHDDVAVVEHERSRWMAVSEIEHVWWYAWVTAISTCFGVVPFLFLKHLPPSLLAHCNSLAGGMMLAASCGLIWEGATHNPGGESSMTSADGLLSSSSSVFAGFIAGLVFILLSKRVLDQHEDLSLIGFEGTSAKRILLMLGVMTLHSLSEGVGIGVSFGSEHQHFGILIAATLAVHNIPEGLATSLVLIPQGVSKLEAAVWAFLTSLPQPIMALPAYVFIQRFLPIFPAGLGFAAGAMLWVACFELIKEASDEIGRCRSYTSVVLSALLMLVVQLFLR